MEVLLDTEQAAAVLGLKRRTLELQRQQGFGPPQIRVSSRTIRYLESDLRDWLESRRRVSTTDGGDER